MKGTADPFQALYNENHTRIRRLLARMAGPEEADDLTQVVFAKAAAALPDFRGDAQASTWLHRIAANVASDWLRSRPAKEAKVTVVLLDGFTAGTDQGSSCSIVESGATPEDELMSKQMCDCIRGVIAELPEKLSSLLMLSDLGGLPDDELARILDISLGSAKVRLHRARAALKRLLEQRCDFSRNEENEFVCEPKAATRCASGVGPSSCGAIGRQGARSDSRDL